MLECLSEIACTYASVDAHGLLELAAGATDGCRAGDRGLAESGDRLGGRVPCRGSPGSPDRGRPVARCRSRAPWTLGRKARSAWRHRAALEARDVAAGHVGRLAVDAAGSSAWRSSFSSSSGVALSGMVDARRRRSLSRARSGCRPSERSVRLIVPMRLGHGDLFGDARGHFERHRAALLGPPSCRRPSPASVAWSVASTRRLLRMVSEAFSGWPSLPPSTDWVRTMSTRSPGKMKPATPVRPTPER